MTEHEAEFPLLYSRSLLVNHFKYRSEYMSISTLNVSLATSVPAW